ncbi:MAG: transaldolase [Chlamydiae bacterium]|nr:transaldolase [Chlamydiota bacterium]
MASKLKKLRQLTTVVADTGEIAEIKKHKPQDATTNPSLLYKAAELPEYQDLVKDAVDYGKKTSHTEDEMMDKIFTKLCVNFGAEILKIVPGRVSTEVDAHLSFNKEASIAKAKEIIDLYASLGVKKERVLIKLASTWEGIRAGEELEKEGIHCNMTLMFGLAQAAAAAEAKVTLISPFVGRILDWHMKNENKKFEPHDDPGVLSVKKIYQYYKYFDYKTQIMGASFRNSGEILELAGIDLLTIAPALLKELEEVDGDVVRKLDPASAKKLIIDHKLPVDEASFRWMLNEDQMATEKLSDGIRVFYKDKCRLMDSIKENFLSGKRLAM